MDLPMASACPVQGILKTAGMDQANPWGYAAVVGAAPTDCRVYATTLACRG